MDIITKFAKTYKNGNSLLRYGTIDNLEELIGPTGDEGLCHFAKIGNNYICTAPHIDLFNVDNSDAILISGHTLDITTKRYDEDDIVSLSQYFLDNKTRGDKIQYLIWWRGPGIADPFVAFVPGLISSSDGEVLGFIHSYVVNELNQTVLEVPYADGKNYTLTGTGFEYEIEGNKFTITISENVATTIGISNGAKDATLVVYPQDYQATETHYRVKVANEYGDYIIAAQITEHNTVPEVLNVLSETVMVSFDPAHGYAPLPKTFKSLALMSFAESVDNVSLGMYRVPVAFVPDEENHKVFMTNITGISTNKINRN